MAEAGQAGLVRVGRAAELVGGLRLRWGSLAPAKKVSFSAGTVFVMLAALGLAWYASRPDYRVLFSGLEGKDMAQVSQELGAAGIPFQMTPDGTGVEVPAEVLDKARMEVAAKGMPQSGRLGFELFDKPNWVGSEFDEKVNYQRALEGELEHTIGTLGVVRSARVHLVLPQQSLFTSEERLAKASVVLKLKRASLPAEQVESIRSLVAGAVENLSPEQVTLVDADGRVSFAARGRGAESGDAEQAMETRLVAMLEPLAGAGNVRATVNVAYDEGTEERTDEVYDPTQTAVLSQQKSEQTGPGRGIAQGVPGTASNTPAAAPGGAVQGSEKAASPGTPPLLQKGGLPVFPQSGGGGQSSKEESGTYAVTKHLVHTEAGPGRLRRVTAAVVVNDRMVTEPAGKVEKVVWRPRTTEEMHRLEMLAQAAVGFDGKRGDQVVLENVSFSSNVAEAGTAAAGGVKVLEEAKSVLLAQPGMLKTGMMGVIGLVLVWFVLRPVAGQMVATMKEPLALVGGTVAEARPITPGVMAAEPAGATLLQESPPAARGGGVLVNEVKGRQAMEEVARLIKKQPNESTRLLETWIMAEGEE